MIFCVLHTGNPTTAFWDLIWRMCTLKSRIPTNDFAWQLSPEMTLSLAKLSDRKAVVFFANLLEPDRDDSRYKTMALRDYLARRGVWRALSRDEEIDFLKFFLHTPSNALIYSQYNPNTDFLSFEFENFKGVEYRNMYLFAEAILQQLITGKGLACPFWHPLSGTCCSDHLRAILEKVWECTSPNGLCDWKRMGCLNQ
jgi:hypothetical protein